MQKKNFKTAALQFISTSEEEAEPKQEAEGAIIPAGYRLAPETKSARLQILLKPTIKARIKAEAERQKMSVNELINIILEEYTKEGRADNDRQRKALYTARSGGLLKGNTPDSI
jgi:hypothetical protein